MSEEVPNRALDDLRHRWRQKSGLPHNYWDKTFSTWKGKHKAFESVKKWAEEFPMTRPFRYPSLFLYSASNGVGKSHLAASVANHLIERWQGNIEDEPACPVRYETGPSLLLRIRDSYEKVEGKKLETEADIYRSLRGTSLLIVDDIGKEKTSAHTSQVYFHIIDQRYSDGLPVMFISNLSMPEIGAFLGNDLLARAVGSRLYEMCQCHFFKIVDKDHRIDDDHTR